GDRERPRAAPCAAGDRAAGVRGLLHPLRGLPRAGRGARRDRAPNRTACAAPAGRRWRARAARGHGNRATVTDRLPSISVVLPAFNEARTIGAVVRGCRAALPPPSEILVVDDGSADATAERAEEAGARVIRLGQNRGKGGAL